MERKLNDQWFEELDGKMHMLRAVKQTNKCSGCVFCTSYWCSDPIQSEREFDCSTMIIKDLGILNDDGFLQPVLWGVSRKTCRGHLEQEGVIMQSRGRSTRPVTVIYQGRQLMTCLSIAEAQRQTGHIVTTIREYANKGRATSDGFSYRLEEIR